MLFGVKGEIDSRSFFVLGTLVFGFLGFGGFVRGVVGKEF